eukprot:5910101-Prymnesium_polylepis.1
MHDQLQIARKAARPSGAAEEKREERQNLISKYVAQDSAVPTELYTLIVYFLSIFIFMCRLPFSM